MSESKSVRTLSAAWAQRPAGAWAAIALVIIINLAHWLYGAQRTEAAMAFNVAIALLLGGLIATPALRHDMAKIKRLIWPAAFFALTLLAVGWSLTPLVPGGPHPAWSYVGERGSASIDPSATIVELFKLLGIGGLFLAGATLGASDKRAHLTLSLMVYSGAAFAAWMFLAYVSGDPTAQFGRRLAGHFLTANTPATLLGVLVVLGLALCLRRARQAPPRHRIAAVAPAASATLICLIALICTASRAGMAATAVGALILLAFEGGRSSHKGKVLTGMLVGLAVAAGLIAFAGDQLISRYFNASEDLAVRALLMQVHWKAFLASPLNGYGLGSFNAINRIYLDPQNFAVLWNVNSTHNVYVQWLEEGGLFAALPMFASIAAVLAVTAFTGLRRDRMRSWLVAILAASVVILLHGWTDFALQAPSVAGLWAVLLGLGFSTAQGSRKQGPVTSSSTWVPVVAVAGSAMVLVCSCLTLIALDAGAATVGGVRLLSLATGYDRAAEASLAAGVSEPNLRAAELSSQEARRLSPYDTGAWLRLVYIDRARAERLRPQAAANFERSYDLVAYDPYVARWRIRFGLENWSELTKQGRRYVQGEAKLLLEDSAHRRYVTGDLENVQSPTGRMVAAFWLNPVGGAKR